MTKKDIKHIQKLIDMKRPNLDDYDNGHKDAPIRLRYDHLDPILSKADTADLRRKLFLEIWRDRVDIAGERRSAISGAKMPERFSTLYFDHLLERNKYPELEFEPGNIIICLPEEHELKTKGFPLEAHIKLIQEAKKKYGYEEENSEMDKGTDEEAPF